MPAMGHVADDSPRPGHFHHHCGQLHVIHRASRGNYHLLISMPVIVVYHFFLPLSASTVPTSAPHILFIVADDLGFNDVSFHGSEIETPFLDSLAQSGVHLTRYYGHSICTPSRSSLMTGRYAFHTGLQHSYLSPGEDVGLPLKFDTLGSHLARAGYSTHAVGKWHLGMQSWSYTPMQRGFDTFYGYLGGGEDYYTHEEGGFVDFRDGYNVPTGISGNYSASLFAERAIEIAGVHGNSTQPIFLYLAMQSVHSPLQAPAKYVGRYSWLRDKARRTMAAMATCMDEELSRVHASFRALGRNLLTVFISDNGGPP